ncbi:hypothetical protein [Amycolatopsis silviterrae]|uniref:Uncharacterized protein n=1 Tax=Amycolatopsis silviterrae TaxID=1656914 RepID=A0ABW5H1V8_9PSEU
MQGERLDGSAQGAAAARGEVFDLEWPQQHRRWIAMVDDTPTGGVYWLGHRTDAGDRAALVGTTLRPDALDGPLGKLMNLVEPVGTMPDRSRVGAAVRQYLSEQNPADWPRVRWTVRDATVDAAVLHFAGAWLAVSDQVAGGHLVTIGTGFSPEGLRFAASSGEEYGVDFTAPLTVTQLHRLPVWQLPQPEKAHADLQRFLA